MIFIIFSGHNVFEILQHVGGYSFAGKIKNSWLSISDRFLRKCDLKQFLEVMAIEEVFLYNRQEKEWKIAFL